MDYRPRLDGLRGLAITMVILSHFVYAIGGTNGGIYGVNLFFVLSGFLITSILLSEKGNDFSSSYKKFIGRRALRIFPIYYLSILFFLIVNVEGITRDWPYLVSYTYNFWVAFNGGYEKLLYGAYWSLSVEEQFYVFFPLIVLLLNKYPRLQLFAFMMIVLLAYLERIFLITGIHTYENLLTNMGALAIGAIGAWFSYNNQLSKKFFNSVFIEIIFFVLLAVSLKVKNTLIIFMIYPLINVFLVIKAARFDYRLKPADKLLTHKWGIFIGKISYGLYLYHIMIQHFVLKYIFLPVWSRIPFESLGYFSKLQYNADLIRFSISLFFTILVSYFSFKYIEAPILKLKNRYFRNQVSQPEKL